MVLRCLPMDIKGVLVVDDAGHREESSRSSLDAFALVANKPIAHHVLDMLELAGVREVVVASSAEIARDVHECLATRESGDGLRLQHVEKRGALDLAGALELAAPMVGDAPCVVHLANGLLDERLAPLLGRLRGDSPDVVLVVHQAPSADEHLSPATQRMLHVAELDPARAALAMAGVSLFGPQALSHIRGISLRAGPDVDLTLLGERIAAAGGSFHVRTADAWCRYTGDTRDLLELNRIALDGLQAEQRRPDNNGNNIEGRVWIHELADVRASVIIGPAIIGPGACVRDAYIGPYTSVGAEAHIEGAEIERSIISAGASIMHVGGRLVASVVGRNARIFRDFSLPRAMRLRVGDGTEVALC